MSLNTETTSAADLEHLRSERRLRALTKEEEGSDIYRLPDGVYGFTYAPGLKEVPIYSKRHYGVFEMQRLANGEVHMVGFVTPAEKAQLGVATTALQIVIFPASWGDSTELIALAGHRLQPAKKAVTREDGNPLRTLVFPA